MAEILNRLDGVRKTGHPSRWTAKCPAHNERRPSLAITERHDGAGLLHCFAGCGAADIVGAVGLQLSDLFPSDEKIHRRRYETKPRIDYRALCLLIKHELTVLEVAAETLAEGNPISKEDLASIQRARRHLRRLHDA